jgi:hypothetical protein
LQVAVHKKADGEPSAFGGGHYRESD